MTKRYKNFNPDDESTKSEQSDGVLKVRIRRNSTPQSNGKAENLPNRIHVMAQEIVNIPRLAISGSYLLIDAQSLLFHELEGGTFSTSPLLLGLNFFCLCF